MPKKLSLVDEEGFLTDHHFNTALGKMLVNLSNRGEIAHLELTHLGRAACIAVITEPEKQNTRFVFWMTRRKKGKLSFSVEKWVGESRVPLDPGVSGELRIPITEMAKLDEYLDTIFSPQKDVAPHSHATNILASKTQSVNLPGRTS